MSTENIGIRELSLEELEQVSGGATEIVKAVSKTLDVAAAVVEGVADLVTAGYAKISPDPWR